MRRSVNWQSYTENANSVHGNFEIGMKAQHFEILHSKKLKHIFWVHQNFHFDFSFFILYYIRAGMNILPAGWIWPTEPCHLAPVLPLGLSRPTSPWADMCNADLGVAETWCRTWSTLAGAHSVDTRPARVGTVLHVCTPARLCHMQRQLWDGASDSSCSSQSGTHTACDACEHHGQHRSRPGCSGRLCGTVPRMDTVHGAVPLGQELRPA